MKDLLKYSFYLILVAIPAVTVLIGLAYILVPEYFQDDSDVGNKRGSIEELFDILPYQISYENDSIKISTVNFPSEDPYLTGVTEVWLVNKLKGDSILCVKSDPRYFGRDADSIPTILNVMYRPDHEKLIVEGPTCFAGTVGTFIVDVRNGEYIKLPTNNGFIGYTNWGDYIVASSKFNGVDSYLALWYENIYVLDWEGNIISYTSMEDNVIEESLADLHYETGWMSEQIKLEEHIEIQPQYADSRFYGNEFRVKYHELALKGISNMGSSDSLPEGWSKHNHIYYYYSDDTDDTDYGTFLTILVDTKHNTGIIRKGGYSNPRNKPKRLYK